MEALLQDIRYAGRVLLKTPMFTAAAVVTLALGIGANTAIFSVVREVLLRRPPVTEPERLAAVYTTCRRGLPRCSSSLPDYEDYRDRSSAFADLAGYSWFALNLGDGESGRLATGQLVTSNYFEVLGVGARLGRVIGRDDAGRGRPATVAVLSAKLWRDQFGADPGVVGRTVRLNGVAFTVIGVVADGFKGLDLANEADVWVSIFTRPLLDAEDDPIAAAETFFDTRGVRWIQTLVGRLAPGVSVVQARQEMASISRQLAEEYPEDRAAMEGPRSITVDPAPRYILPVGSESDLKRFIWLLFGVVGATLLLATANLANLLLVRASGRRREIGIRLAVGAGRGRLIRQLLTESMTLGLAGGAVGLVVAIWMLDLLSAFQLPGGVSIGALEVGLDSRVLLFALLLSLVTSVAFGLIPALQASRPEVVSSLKGGESERGAGHDRLRKALVAVQVALCLVLLVGSGLFVRALRNSLEFDPGFRSEGVALARFNLALLRYTPEQGGSFVERLLERVRGLPDVTAASVATLVPLQAGGFRGTFVTVSGYHPAPDEEMRVDYLFVEPGYFRALGIPLVRGRVIEAGDRESSRPVMVINQDMARRYWPGRDPLGGIVDFGELQLEVVGVVENPVWTGLGESPTPFVFLPLPQYPAFTSNGFLTLLARTAGDPRRLLRALPEELRSLDPQLSISSLQTMKDQLNAALMPQRMGAALLSLFGSLALVLAAVGIYGVVGYTVARQSRSIAIRMALGARDVDVLALVVRGMSATILVGLGAGLLVALALTRTVEAFLFGVGPDDPLTFGVLGIFLASVALVATLLPARRATRMKPMAILRTE